MADRRAAAVGSLPAIDSTWSASSSLKTAMRTPSRADQKLLTGEDGRSTGRWPTDPAFSVDANTWDAPGNEMR